MVDAGRERYTRALRIRTCGTGSFACAHPAPCRSPRGRRLVIRARASRREHGSRIGAPSLQCELGACSAASLQWPYRGNLPVDRLYPVTLQLSHEGAESCAQRTAPPAPGQLFEGLERGHRGQAPQDARLPRCDARPRAAARPSNVESAHSDRGPQGYYRACTSPATGG